LLKSYEFTENMQFDATVTDNALLLEERNLAFEFVRNVPEYKAENAACPACGEMMSVLFMEIFGIEYRRCGACHSLFVPIKPEVVMQYANHKDLLNFQRSSKFQQTISALRTKLWSETLFWINFRTARYLGRNNALNILEYDGIYTGLSQLLQRASLCGKYVRRSEVLGNIGEIKNGEIEMALYWDTLPSSAKPLKILSALYESLSWDGILMIATRVGSGFDILTLKEKSKSIYPYKCIFLPSLQGLEILLERAGFEVLEISTPGMFDVNNVLENRHGDNLDLFADYLFNHTDLSVLSDFQRFLQKSGLSSYSRIIARKLKKEKY